MKTDLKIAVICPSNSAAARQAREAGAAMVGEEEVFQVVKSGKFEFDRVIAQPGSLPKINKEGLGRILGPRGLMPSAKLGTLVEGVAGVVKTMLGGSMYRERVGVVRMAVGQLGFSPEMLRDNLRAFVGAVRKDGSALTEGGGQSVMKEIAEVVSFLGFSLFLSLFFFFFSAVLPCFDFIPPSGGLFTPFFPEEITILLILATTGEKTIIADEPPHTTKTGPQLHERTGLLAERRVQERADAAAGTAGWGLIIGPDGLGLGLGLAWLREACLLMSVFFAPRSTCCIASHSIAIWKKERYGPYGGLGNLFSFYTQKRLTGKPWMDGEREYGGKGGGGGRSVQRSEKATTSLRPCPEA